jgi:hypothetical protein
MHLNNESIVVTSLPLFGEDKHYYWRVCGEIGWWRVCGEIGWWHVCGEIGWWRVCGEIEMRLKRGKEGENGGFHGEEGRGKQQNKTKTLY